MLSDQGTVRELSLDGDWQAGIGTATVRHYDRTLRVPGLATDPAKPTPGTLWYKRTVDLPAGNWTSATLTLKGARFAPRVFVDGRQVSSAEGGMAATIHRFALPAGKSFTLEIALESLKDLDKKDASAVPGPDLWRNNDSSYLWDSVILRLHGAGEIERITPFTDLKSDSVSLHWQIEPWTATKPTIVFKILDEQGNALVASEAQPTTLDTGAATLHLKHRIEPWSPEHPHLYRLRTELFDNGKLTDATEQSFGLRDFTVHGLRFQLNGEPYHIRMGTVVWHRWTRDPEAKLIAFDPVWFENNVVLRLKSEGANALRFHLGLPPEEFLDLCDRDGLAVQMEWPFFHGIAASPESMAVQWRAWLDTAMRHPSVVVVHPWNETGGPVVHVAFGVLDKLLKNYPPMVVAHRDVVPIHKYWWSLFENVGLYYDSASQFGQAVMVDEFGGDYLDRNGDPGGYPTTRDTFLRFLGRNNTREERLQLQDDANARIAEYWRRLGVAGFSPFCILGSPQDGNDWFLGKLDVPHPEPKPVWAALSAAFAQQSVSLEIWDRNFSPGERIHLPLWFFNDSDHPQAMRASVHVVDAATLADAIVPVTFSNTMVATTSGPIPIDVTLPDRTGEWRIEARLEDPASPPAGPVVSSWRIRTFIPTASVLLQSTPIGVPEGETELRTMLEQMHLHVVAPGDPTAHVLIGSRTTWKKLHDDHAAISQYDALLHNGESIVLTDVGPQPLGVGYAPGAGLGGPLEGAPTVKNPATLEQTSLFGDVKVSFVEVPEPESAIQQPVDNKQLWTDVPHEATWLWNGLRGGLIVPAVDMQISGLSGKALLADWVARGADADQISTGDYFAYELAGYYAFARAAQDKTTSDALRKRVRFLVEDAPALKGIINPESPITVTDLNALFKQGSTSGQVESVTPMANAGKGLGRTPVVKLTFKPGEGSVIVSQLITAGRLLPDHSESGPGVYGLRYDPVAVQFVLNMLDAAISTGQGRR
jgi:beta-galactosidase